MEGKASLGACTDELSLPTTDYGQKPGSGRPESGRPDSARPGSGGKTQTSNCPTIQPDPNEATTGPECNEYFCTRDCNEGFYPTHPMKVLLSLINILKITVLIRYIAKKVTMETSGLQFLVKQH